MLKGKTVLLGVTGSIAAYKIANLARSWDYKISSDLDLRNIAAYVNDVKICDFLLSLDFEYNGTNISNEENNFEGSFKDLNVFDDNNEEIVYEVKKEVGDSYFFGLEFCIVNRVHFFLKWFHYTSNTTI